MINSQVKLINEQVFKDRNLVHANVPLEMLTPSICAVQDLYVHPILGDTLYYKLKADKKASTLSGIYLDLVNNYILDILIYGVMADYVIDSTYQNYTKGVTKKRDDFADSTSYDELEKISDRHKNKMDSYLQRLVNYLQNNKTLFPEYTTESTDVNATTNTYSPSIYLKDDKKGCEWR
jgi:hypothetical protein